MSVAWTPKISVITLLDVKMSLILVKQLLKADKVKSRRCHAMGSLEKAVHALLKYPKSRAFLLECTELPPYSDAIRFYTGLPVYDSITACHFFISGHKDNPRFGLDNWQDEWDGKQEDYQYGDNLTEEEKGQLVNKVD